MAANCVIAQALWADQPPEHIVECLTALPSPLSIWTGGREGNIVKWSISTTASKEWGKCREDSNDLSGLRDEDRGGAEQKKTSEEDQASPPEASHGTRRVWPAALLHGHKSPISFLTPCSSGISTPSAPTAAHTSYTGLSRRLNFNSAEVSEEVSACGESGTEKKSGTADVTFADSVLSACQERVLCVWDVWSGRCRIRRKLPLGTGTPNTARGVPNAMRYVCIGCNNVSMKGGKLGQGEGAERLGTGAERVTSLRNRGEGIGCCIVVVDVLSLTVLQTIGSEELSVDAIWAIGLNTMKILGAGEASGPSGYAAIIADRKGQVHKLEGLIGANPVNRGALVGDKENTRVHGCTVAVSLNALLVLHVGTHGWLLESSALGKVLMQGDWNGPIFETAEGLDDEVRIAENKRRDALKNPTLLAGGIFLEGTGFVDEVMMSAETQSEEFEAREKMPCGFLIWDEAGAAKLYSIPDSLFHAPVPIVKTITFLPPVKSNGAVAFSSLQFQFTQLGDMVVRTVRGPSILDNGLGTNLQLEVWHSRSAGNNQGDALLYESTLLRQGWQNPSEWPSSEDLSDNVDISESFLRKIVDANTEKHGEQQGWKDVATASCLVNGGLLAPAVLVRGYSSGVIKVLALTADSWQNHNEEVSEPQWKPDDSDNPLAVKSLLGHKGPVLCLVEHNAAAAMGGNTSPHSRSSNISTESQPSRVLLSSSMDWTVRIWDFGGEGIEGDFLLGEITALAVLHHHTSPVRQLILPPSGTPPPWAYCFLSLSDDGVVALSSIETLSCERIFPGHSSLPKRIVWDGQQGYVACLCSCNSVEESLGAKESQQGEKTRRKSEVENWGKFESRNDDESRATTTVQEAQSGGYSKEVEDEAREDNRLADAFEEREQVDTGFEEEKESRKMEEGSKTVAGPSLSSVETLFVWDLQSGARERILKGLHARSLYNHLVARVAAYEGVSRGAFDQLQLDILEEVNLQKRTWKSAPTKTDNLSAVLTSFASNSSSSFSGAMSTLALSAHEMSVKTSSSDALNYRSAATSPVRSPPSLLQQQQQLETQAVQGGCPIPGVAVVKFDLRLLLLLTANRQEEERKAVKKSVSRMNDPETGINQELDSLAKSEASETNKGSEWQDRKASSTKEMLKASVDMDFKLLGLEGRSLRLALSFLHIWGLDSNLDKRLRSDLRVSVPDGVWVGGAVIGDKGALTLGLPNKESKFEFWSSTPAFSAIHCVAIIALSKSLALLNRSAQSTCLKLAEHYSQIMKEGVSSTWNPLKKKLQVISPPSLEILACFWQDQDVNIRSASRSLFHSAALRSFPSFLRPKVHAGAGAAGNLTSHALLFPPTPDSLNPSRSQTPSSQFEMLLTPPSSASNTPTSNSSRPAPRASSILAINVPPQPDWGGWEPSEVSRWLESGDDKDWIAWVGGGARDARQARIIMSAALSIWYPSKGRPDLAPAVAPPLLSLVRAANSQHSAAAADLLAEGMQSTWLPLIGPQVPRLIADVFTLCESLGGWRELVGTGKEEGEMLYGVGGAANVSVGVTMKETLTRALLPTLASANMPAFLASIHNQLITLPAESTVHKIAFAALLAAIRGNPRAAISHLNQVAVLLMQAIDPASNALRKTCLQGVMEIIVELPKYFATAAIHNGTSAHAHARLAVGEALVDSAQVAIHIYDLHSAAKVRILDASGPPGHPGLMGPHNRGGNTTKLSSLGSLGGISAIAFSPDGEGLVAFSQRGMVLRWWSLGSQWWEKLSRGPSLMHCSKMVLVPPLPGISSFPSLVGGTPIQSPSIEMSSRRGQTPMATALLTLDLGFRLEWRPNNSVTLYHNGVEVGAF